MAPEHIQGGDRMRALGFGGSCVYRQVLDNTAIKFPEELHKSSKKSAYDISSSRLCSLLDWSRPSMAFVSL